MELKDLNLSPVEIDRAINRSVEKRQFIYGLMCLWWGWGKEEMIYDLTYSTHFGIVVRTNP